MKAPSAKPLVVEDFVNETDVGEAFKKFLQPYNQFTSQTLAALSSGLTFSDNFKARLKTLIISPAAEMFEPTLLSGWKNWDAAGVQFGRAKYTKDVTGRVQLSGLIYGGTVATNDTSTILLLPTGYRPAEERIFTVESNGVAGELRVSALGLVKAWVGNNAWMSLENISFHASDRTPIVNSIFPIDFLNELPGKSPAAGVIPVAVQDTGTRLPVGGPIFCEWVSHGDQVRILNITGLQPGKRYSVTLLYFTDT